MKKYFLLVFLIFIGINPVYSIGNNKSYYYDKGLIYTNNSFPQCVSNNNQDNQLFPIENFNNLKKGESSASNVLNLFEFGDASINTAAKNGNISKIYYVENKIDKVFVPILFIPFYIKEKKTYVYGE